MFIRLIIVIAFIITAGLAIPGFANPENDSAPAPSQQALVVRADNVKHFKANENNGQINPRRSLEKSRYKGGQQ